MRATQRAELTALEQIVEVEREKPPIDQPTIYPRIVTCLAIVVALWWAQAVIIPIVLSVLLSYALEPLVARLVACRLPRAVAAPLLLTFFIVSFGLVVYGLRGEATAFANRIPAAMRTVSHTLESFSERSPGTLTRMKDAAHELEAASQGSVPSDGVASVRVEQPTFRWSDWLWQGSRSAFEFGGQMLAVLCLTYCLLAGGDLYKRKLVHIVPTFSDKKITVQILAEIDRQIERYILARGAISIIVGIVVAIGFHLVGMQEAGVWGVLSAFLFTIPIVGPTLVLVGAALAAFVQFGTAGAAAGVAALCLIIGAVEGNLLTPWLLSRVGEMNTTAVFVSLLFWGWIWGGWGLLLAVPITASIKAVCERVPDLNSFSELLKA